jgi:DNA processing protein
MLPLDNLRRSFPTRIGMPDDVDFREASGKAAARGISKVAEGSADYPVRLLSQAHPPSPLWFVGRLPPAGEKTLAVVGSRAASGAGVDRARRLAHEAARAGWTVVSGGAFGIDAAAHEGALDAAAATYAVLGCGVDVVYPDRHEVLFRRISATGGLLSEYDSGTPPRRGQFPARNRIIVALSDVVVVVEAAWRSGALITARQARGQGRRVLAMPGSPGTDALLASGHACPIAGFEDLEAALTGTQQRPLAALALATLRDKADTAEGLAHRLNISVGTALGVLTEAEVDGWVRRGPGGRFEVRLGH